MITSFAKKLIDWYFKKLISIALDLKAKIQAYSHDFLIKETLNIPNLFPVIVN